MIFIAIIIIFFLYLGVEKMLRNKYNIKKQEGLYRHVNKSHQRWEMVITIGSILIFSFMKFGRFGGLEFHYFLIALIILFGFRGFMEWKYEKESKTYILSILGSVAFILFFIVATLFK